MTTTRYLQFLRGALGLARFSQLILASSLTLLATICHAQDRSLTDVHSGTPDTEAIHSQSDHSSEGDWVNNWLQMVDIFQQGE